MPAAEIPTKATLHRAFTGVLEPPPTYERHNTGALQDGRPASHACARRLLDFGCGDGRLSVDLALRCPELEVCGIDINAEAIANATERALAAGVHDRATFQVADVTHVSLADTAPRTFDIVLLQLVISLVGEVDKRLGVLRAAHHYLAPGGTLLVSASAVSDDINPKYKALYDQDEHETGERYSYFSRDEAGKILYRTHHFQYDELRALLQDAGFDVVELHKDRETSSRRPSEAAWFLYGVAHAR